MDYSMNTAPAPVVTAVSVELLDAHGGATPIRAELRYDAADPFAVTAVFKTAAGDVRWTFGRALLLAGLHEPAGDGDVHVWPCLDSDGRAVVIIELCSPDGEALIQIRNADMHAFADAITAAVPPGTESHLLDVDEALAAIFAAEAA